MKTPRSIPVLLLVAIFASLITSQPAAAAAFPVVAGWGDNFYGEATIPDGLENVIAIAA